MTRRCLMVAALIAAPSVACAQASAGRAGTFVIRNASVWTGVGPALSKVNVVIRDGRIGAVGPTATAAGATVIDATGKWVYPGMIDAYTPLGLTEVGGIDPMNLRSELGQYNPHMRAVAAINVECDMMAVTRANGVLSALSAPNGGVISGQAALINTAGWTSEDIAVLPAAAMVLNYPRAASSAAAALAAYREQVRRLESELRTASQYDARRRTGLDEIRTVYEAMRPMMRGELPVFVTADTEDQIRGALAMSDSFGLKLIIYGGREAWRVRDLLARRQVPVVLASMQRIPGADQTYDAIFTAPGVLVAAGVKIAFSTGTAASSRHLPFHASLAVAYGLSKEDAMKALTIWPAEIFGASTRIGSIEVGKMANLFIATGDPLDIRSQVVDLFIKGRRVPMDDRQSRLYEKYKERPSAGRK